MAKTTTRMMPWLPSPHRSGIGLISLFHQLGKVNVTVCQLRNQGFACSWSRDQCNGHLPMLCNN